VELEARESPSPQDVCAVILAGGESRRMGSNKALLELCGEPLVRRQARLAAQVAGRSWFRRMTPLPAIGWDFHPAGSVSGLRSHRRYPFGDEVFQTAASSWYWRATSPGSVSSSESSSAGSAATNLAVPRTSDGRFHPCAPVTAGKLLPNLEARLQTGRYRLTESSLIRHFAPSWVD